MKRECTHLHLQCVPRLLLWIVASSLAISPSMLGQEGNKSEISAAATMQTWLFPQGQSCLPRELTDQEDSDEEGITARVQWNADPKAPSEGYVPSAEDKRVREYLGKLNITFPAGAYVRLLPATRDLLMRNSQSNLERTERLLHMLNQASGGRSVEIAALFLRIPASVGADWGLDGGPTLKPETTPLGKAIPAIMDGDETRLVVSALRKHVETDVLGSARCLTLSGNTALSRVVVEKQLLMDDEPRDMGISLEVTPTVASDAYTIDLELRLRCLVLDQRSPRTPSGGDWMQSVAAFTCETKIVLRDGNSAFVSAGVPAPLTLPEPEGQDRRPILVLITARLLHTTVQNHMVVEESE